MSSKGSEDVFNHNGNRVRMMHEDAIYTGITGQVMWEAWLLNFEENYGEIRRSIGTLPYVHLGPLLKGVREVKCTLILEETKQWMWWTGDI